MSVAQTPDIRRRPPPLAMANDGSARARLSINTMDAYNPPLMGSPGPQIVDYDAQPNGPTTPTSATFSTATGSPARFGSTIQSPTSTPSRPVSWAGAPPGRRVSISSSGNPFSGPPGPVAPPYMSPLPSQPSAAPVYSGQSSAYASPTTSNFSEHRRESNADADWRRRTWHPGTYTGPRPATSGLGYHQTPDALRPSYTSQPAASQTTRLPGIESFDYAPPPPALTRLQPGPMQMNSQPRPLTYQAPIDSRLGARHEKRTSISWEINRLELNSPGMSREQWSHYPQSGQSSTGRPLTAPHGYFSQHQSAPVSQPPINSPTQSARNSQEQPATPRKNKRQAWYMGPISQPARATMQRTSPEDSSSSEGVPTPGISTMAEYHPAIMHNNEHVEAQPSGPQLEEPKTSIMERPRPFSPQYRHYHSHSLSSSGYHPQREPEKGPAQFGQPLPQTSSNDMRRLEALVAVATGEQQTVENRS